MGGLSQGYVGVTQHKWIFSGKLSTENNGGFSSVYCTLPNLHKEIDALSIKIVGDGHCYHLRIRSLVDGYNVAYKVNISTQKKIIQQLTFKLSDFQATFRGRTLNNPPLLIPVNSTHVGFLISNTQAIDFSLQVDDITFYVSNN